MCILVVYQKYVLCLMSFTQVSQTHFQLWDICIQNQSLVIFWVRHVDSSGLPVRIHQELFSKTIEVTRRTLFDGVHVRANPRAVHRDTIFCHCIYWTR